MLNRYNNIFTKHPFQSLKTHYYLAKKYETEEHITMHVNATEMKNKTW